jgi:hypothetical protein
LQFAVGVRERVGSVMLSLRRVPEGRHRDEHLGPQTTCVVSGIICAVIGLGSILSFGP